MPIDIVIASFPPSLLAETNTGLSKINGVAVDARGYSIEGTLEGEANQHAFKLKKYVILLNNCRPKNHIPKLFVNTIDPC